jgi:hypothetical protein
MLNKKFWEEVIAYFPSIRHGPHIKRRTNNSIILCVFFAAVTFLPCRFLATIVGYTYRQTGGRDL